MSLQTLNSANTSSQSPSASTSSPNSNSGSTAASNPSSQRKSTPKISHLPIAPTRGTFQVFTSAQRGFHSEVMAQSLRLASLGTPVLVVQFFQGGINQGIENPRILGQNMTWIRSQLDRNITAETELTPPEVMQITQLWSFVKNAVSINNYGLVVLDELNLAIELRLIPEIEVMQLLSDRPISLDLILTGAKMPNSLIEFADQVTDRRN
jgi:cob(I)alamin adenosyltransferase